ncbi:alpha/beta fold hydrolase [Dysosmobacter sp.]|uniref:alpha/beta fold hydrolase n=1 Tax=Dysosmobacter sp. TaxID=2591382 RepID=UPI003AB7BEB4
MKVYEFGKKSAPALLLLPGTCCHWKGNFGRVIPLLEKDFRVLCVSYDGFDETENTEFPTMLEETEKIEAYIKEHCSGHIHGAYGCSLRGSFVGLLAARQNIHMDYGILGSSDLDQSPVAAAKLQTALLLPLLYPFIRDGKFKSRILQKKASKTHGADGSLCAGVYGHVGRRAALCDYGKLQKPVLLRSHYTAAGSDQCARYGNSYFLRPENGQKVSPPLPAAF